VRGSGWPHARLDFRRNLRNHVKKWRNLLIYIINMVACGCAVRGARCAVRGAGWRRSHGPPCPNVDNAGLCQMPDVRYMHTTHATNGRQIFPPPMRTALRPSGRHAPHHHPVGCSGCRTGPIRGLADEPGRPFAERLPVVGHGHLRTVRRARFSAAWTSRYRPLSIDLLTVQ
jgi:hypothetical protein